MKGGGDSGARRGLTRYAQLGLVVNTALAVVKGIAGVAGHSYALVADAIESLSDVFGSLVVWGALSIASRDADDRFPFGYGKAESLAAVVVGLMLGGAAVAIAIAAVREILTPHHAPAPYTLVVLVVVVLVKETLFRRIARAGEASASTALAADAWHHRSDAITSVAAFVGISVALLGGPGWEQADDWGALVASAVILTTAFRTLRPAVLELMDQAPEDEVRATVGTAVQSVAEARGFHRLRLRRTAGAYFIAVDVQADPALTLHEAHVVSGRVKAAIRAALPATSAIIVHMEPDEDGAG